VEDFKVKLAAVLQARSEAGRDGPSEVTVSGTLAPGLDGYRRLQEAGAIRILVPAPRPADGHPDPRDWADWSKRLADEVIAMFDER
jgi:hypothetical protein